MNILIILVVSIICVLPIAQCNKISCYTCSGGDKCSSNDKSLLSTCSCGGKTFACMVSSVFFFFYL
jgi:hypothetical protein